MCYITLKILIKYYIFNYYHNCLKIENELALGNDQQARITVVMPRNMYVGSAERLLGILISSIKNTEKNTVYINTSTVFVI